MKYKAQITCNATGETVMYESSSFEEHSATTFLWTDGNFSCDCNRELFFFRAKGEEKEETKCGDERYSVKLIFENGRVEDMG